jgi:hypothetical protein
MILGFHAEASKLVTASGVVGHNNPGGPPKRLPVLRSQFRCKLKLGLRMRCVGQLTHRGDNMWTTIGRSLTAGGASEEAEAVLCGRTHFSL